LDWHVDATDPAAVASLRRDVVSYLRRHGESGSDSAAADAALDVLFGAVAGAEEGSAWARLDRSGETAVLEDHHLTASRRTCSRR
jgi:hypothetical protein